MTGEKNTQMGGMNLSDITDSEIKIGGDVDASMTAEGHIAGRDVVIYNYHYHTQAEVSPPTPARAETDEAIPDNPYRGLFTFRPEHAPFFFGREGFTADLVTAVESRRLVTVLGASGSGKSSVVFAGLVPELTTRPGEPWLFTTFRPGDDPFLGLANALIPLLEPELSTIKQIGEARDLSSRLRAGQAPLSDYLNHIQQNQPDHRLLIIADQFEELYTLYRDTDARHAFLDLLLSVLPDSHSQLTMVLTLRADFLGQASLYRPFADALQGDTELLGPMTDEELRDAIEKPAAVQDVTFEEGLVETLLADVGHEEGSLPLLEFALSELWQHQTQRTLTHRAYVEIERVEGALSRHADRAYSSLLPQEQQQARRIFVQLVNPGRGTEDTRRLATRKDLGQNWDLVAKLANERLVVTGRATPDPNADQPDTDEATQQDTVEVVHEALIRNWGQLREWMDADREFLTWQLGLRADLARWEETERDDGALLRGAPLAVAQEKFKERPDDLNKQERDFIEASLEQQHRQERNRRWTLIGVGVAAVVMAVLAGVSFILFQNAQDSEAKALAAQATAEAGATAIAEQKEGASFEKEMAEIQTNFSQEADPATRVEYLANLFTAENAFSDQDYDDEAVRLFWGLTEAEQLALFQEADPKRLLILSRGLSLTMADVNGLYLTTPLLAAMQKAVAELDGDEAVALATELDQWLAAREATQNGDKASALEAYDQLIDEVNGGNPATRFERARLRVAIDEDEPIEGEDIEAALADLEVVAGLVAESPVFAGREVFESGMEFGTRQRIIREIKRLIYWIRPELGQAFNADTAAYPNLAAAGLAPPPEVILSQVGDLEVPMVRIEGGTFTMGSSSNVAGSDETPHNVSLRPFLIDQYEVTNEQFVAFLNDQTNREEGGVPRYNSAYGRITQQGTIWQVADEYAQHPVTGISWYGAKSYCAWRVEQSGQAASLPTEAQWEKAARGPDGRTYPWGEGVADHLLNFSGNVVSTTSVGGYRQGVSPYGVYNMAGNVWEWVQSLYWKYPYQFDEREDLNSTDPRVLRGGSWDGLEGHARSASRISDYPGARYSGHVGFRCVAVAP